MVNTNKLRGIMAEQGKTGVDMAKSLGVDKNTFYGYMKKGVFPSNVIEEIVQILHIDDPVAVFFAPNVTQGVTNFDSIRKEGDD